MHSKLIVPIVVAALVGVRLYLRMRRSFGRQRVQPRRMTVRISIFAVLVALLALLTRGNAQAVAALLGGGACGAALGHLGLRHTRFESTAEGRFYTPHTYIGLTVTVLFLARLAYDFFVVYHGASPVSASGPGALPPESPLTLAISGAFIAYYLMYYTGVLLKSRQPTVAEHMPIPTEPS